MSDMVMIWSLSLASIATAVVAGVFLTFSDFVMRSLASVGPSTGIAAMQAINRKVLRSVFLVLLLAMAPVSVVAIGYGLASGDMPVWPVAGGAVYLSGVFFTTLAFNVPMNKRLDGIVPGTAISKQYWPDYLRVWTRWNHVRSLASFVSAGCFLTGAISLGGAV